MWLVRIAVDQAGHACETECKIIQIMDETVILSLKSLATS
jgi:hypothetical protein